MLLSQFIRSNSDEIIHEWESFARTLVPRTPRPTPLTLRDHIQELLDFIVEDIDSKQTGPEQVEKSRGEKPRSPNPTAAEVHASLRHAGGFNLDQMVSEYRALRASVVKLWQASLTDDSRSHLVELTRFNEAIDQALTESIRDYSEKLDTSRTLFLGTLSHDLRNPLGAIAMSADLTTRIGSLSDRQTMLLAQVGDSAARATEIVSQLLAITKSRLGSGLPIVREDMDLGFVARQLIDEAKAMHPNQLFDLDLSGNLHGRWDKARLGQVLSNLIGNAIQYGFKDAPVALQIVGRESEIDLSIHNDGLPIASSAMTSIFNAMTRGGPDTGLPSANLGLGLYITKEIVQAHGGTIDVTSTEIGGTTFHATLPR